MPAIGDSGTVKIDRMAAMNGSGVGRLDGLVLFIPHTAPGDIVEAEVTELKKNYAVGRVLNFLEPSIHRREPPCPVANQCGGCSWQHIRYDEQIRQKQSLFEYALRTLKKLEDFKIKPLEASPAEFGYRNRVQVHQKASQIGFLAKGSSEIVPTPRCHIANETVNELWQKLAQENFSGERRVELTSLEGNEYFAQVNSGVNKKLLKAVTSEVLLHPPQRIFDLYGGAGNFAEALFELASVDVVELDEKAVAAGKNYFVSSHDVHFHHLDVAEFLKAQKPGAADVVILDPPRKGCAPEVLTELLRLKPTKIIYVSCHPASWVRDLEKLLAQYKIDWVQGFDMFPQTAHLEALAVLSIKLGA